jgi:DNA-binding XRE family transcriptional regulator
VTTRRFSAGERAIVAEHYPAGGSGACLPLMPGRSLYSIYKLARRMGVAGPRGGRRLRKGHEPLNAFDGRVLRTFSDVNELRLAVRMSQRELARLSGYSVICVQTILRGRHSPRLRTAIDVVNALGFDLVLRRRTLGSKNNDARL